MWKFYEFWELKLPSYLNLSRQQIMDKAKKYTTIDKSNFDNQELGRQQHLNVNISIPTE